MVVVLLEKQPKHRNWSYLHSKLLYDISSVTVPRPILMKTAFPFWQIRRVSPDKRLQSPEGECCKNNHSCLEKRQIHLYCRTVIRGFFRARTFAPMFVRFLAQPSNHKNICSDAENLNFQRRILTCIFESSLHWIYWPDHVVIHALVKASPHILL